MARRRALRETLASVMRIRLRCSAVPLLAGVLLLPVGCLRGPITDEPVDGADGDGSDDDTSDADTTEGDTGEATSGTCHSSYDPCLPIVDDLDCADVRALGAAPVMVIGPDEYGLDRDNDGIGCET